MKRTPHERGCRVRVLLVHLIPEGHQGNSLGIACLKTYADSRLRGKADIRCLTLRMDRSREFQRRVANELSAFRPHIAGFSCCVWNLAAAHILAREAKTAGARVVLGGPETYGDVAGLLRKFRADAAVVGEGELTFTEMLDRFRSGASWDGVRGAASRSGEHVLIGSPRELIQDLDDIPSPYLKGLFDAHQGTDWMLETQRGCWCKCSYCATWSMSSPVRYFSLHRISQEIAWLARRTLRDDHISIIDSDVSRPHARGMALLRRFRGFPRRVLFSSNLNYWDEALMKACHTKQPMLEVSLGVNAIDDSVCAQIGRPRTKVPLLESKLARIHELAPDFKVTFELMIPLPGETARDCREKVDWALRQTAGKPRIYRTMVLPGTRLAQDAKKMRLDHMHEPPYYLLATKDCSRRDLRSLELAACGLNQLMSVPVANLLLKWLADESHGGSILSAFEAVCSKLPGASRKRLLAAQDKTLKRPEGFELINMRPQQNLSVDESLTLACSAIGSAFWPATLGPRRVLRCRVLARAGLCLELSSTEGDADVLIQTNSSVPVARHDAIIDFAEAPGLRVYIDVARRLLGSAAGLVELGSIMEDVLCRLAPHGGRALAVRLLAANALEPSSRLVYERMLERLLHRNQSAIGAPR